LYRLHGGFFSLKAGAPLPALAVWCLKRGA